MTRLEELGAQIDYLVGKKHLTQQEAFDLNTLVCSALTVRVNNLEERVNLLQDQINELPRLQTS